jgi:UDP:flavonoid glycosyltransferase YjiC (YdhE family)
MHILAVTWDGGGNLPPLLGLVETLTARGHSIRVLSHTTQMPALGAAGAEPVPFPSAPDCDAGAPAFSSEQGFFSWLMAFDQGAARDLRDVVSASRPDLLLVDCMLPATLNAAASLNLPVVSLVHAAWASLRDIPGEPFRVPTEASSLVLVFSHPAFDPASPLDNFVWVGPARGRASSTHWQRRRPDLPFVVASLSSAQQGQGYILSNVAEALRTAPVEALLSVGRGFDPAMFTRGPTMSIESSVPHELVLDGADLFVTHAGHGSVMAGLVGGTPMLCLPGLGDQPFNAARVAALGVGEVLAPDASPNEIAAAINRMLDDGPLRSRARAFAEAMRNPIDLNTGLTRIEQLIAS